jgi:chloramphenicol 3-O-phosphotransferase
MKDVLIQSAIAHLEAGHLLVMDIVFSPTSALSLKTSLARFKPSIVQVTASLDVLEKREIERGNRNIGMAAQQFNDFGDDHIGDLVINTDTNTATESANLIIKHLCLRSNQTNGSKPRTPSTNP